MSIAISGSSWETFAQRRSGEGRRFAQQRRRFNFLVVFDALVAGILVGTGMSVGLWWCVAAALLLTLAALVIDRRMVKQHYALLAQIVTDELLYVAAAGLTVSVVIPAFNAEHLVGIAIESIKRQSYPRWQCIVVDDGSSDGTVAAALEAAQDDPRIMVLRLAVNSGASVARNAGLAAASGDYLVYLDADDVLLSDALRNRIAKIMKFPNATGAFGRQTQIGDATGWESMPTLRGSKSPENVNILTAGGDQPFIPHQVLMKRSSARDLAGFDETMRNNMDFDHWMRSLRSGHEFIYCGYIDCLYLQQPDSIVGKGVEAHGRRFMAILDAEWDGKLSGFRASGGDDLDGPLAEILRAGIAQMRYLRIAGMMIGVGQDPADVAERIADIDPPRHPLPPEYAIKELMYGIRREYRRGSTDDDQLISEAALAKATQCVPALVPERKAVVIAPANQPTWAVVVTSLPQAQGAMRALEDLPDQVLPMFVTTDSWLGDSGANSYLATHPRAVVSVSLPAFFLQGVVYQSIVVPADNKWVWDTVSAIAANRGSPVVSVDLENDRGLLVRSATPRGQVRRIGVYETFDFAPILVRSSPPSAVVAQT